MSYMILGNKFYMREVVPGSRTEYEIVDELKKVFNEICDWVKIVETPTLYWSDVECYLEVKNTGELYNCVALPYTLTSSVEGRVIHGVLHGGDILLNGDPRDSIVLIEYPSELDLVKYISMKLAEKGVKAIVFYDKTPSVLRRSVVVFDEVYSFNHGSPPSIPIVSMDRVNIDRLTHTCSGECMVELHVKTIVEHNRLSKSLIAGLNGSGEREIHITAHHDHWFKGFSDNLIGVEILYQVARSLKNWRGVNIVFISFTSEEIGAPNYSSWYWAWGSRYYLRLLEASNTVDRIVADVNVDAIYKYPVEIYANPSLFDIVLNISDDRVVLKGYDHMDFDSYSYTLHGVPSMTLTSITSLKPVYHSNLDDGSTIDHGVVEYSVKLVLKIIEVLNDSKPSLNKLLNYIKEKLEKSPLIESRIITGKLENLRQVMRSEDSIIRFITRNFTRTLVKPGLKFEYMSDLFADVEFITSMLSGLDKRVGERVKLYDFDELILDVFIEPRSAGEIYNAIVNAVKSRMQKYNEIVEKEIVYRVLNQMCLDKLLKSKNISSEV